MTAASPAGSQAPRCDAETCPPLQLRLEEGFQVSSQRLEQGMPAVAPAPAPTTATERVPPPMQPQLAATGPSPWLVAAFALVAGMLLQGLIQGLMRRRRVVVAAPAAVVPTAAPAPASARATGFWLDAPEEEPAASIRAEPPTEFAGFAVEASEPVTVAEARLEPAAPAEPPSAELPALVAEALPEPEEAPQAAEIIELELPPTLAIAELPVPPVEAAEPEAIAPAGEPQPEPEIPEAALVEAEATEPAAEALAVIEPAPESVEGLSSPVEESQDAVVFELEPLPTSTLAETPAPQTDAVESAEPLEATPVATIEPDGLELSGEAPADTGFPVDFPLDPVEVQLEPVEEPQDPVVFELEPLPDSAYADMPAPPTEAVESAEPLEAMTAGEPVPEVLEAAPVESIEPDSLDLSVEAPAEFEFELDFPLEPEALDAAGEEPPPVEAEDWFMAAALTATGGDPSVAAPPAEPAPVEAAAAQPASLPEPAPAAASDTHRLETVALLRRLSAQRARGLHPEARLASVFRRISSGRLEAADKSLRELEAFCNVSEEGFPSELLTTRQHIVRGRDYELGKRIDGLQVRAKDEASGRRLAVAGAFLRRGRFDAVAEVLDELESDLSRENEVP